MAFTVSFLPQDEWRGKKLDFNYETDAIYDVLSEQTADGWRLTLKRTPLPAPESRGFTDTLLSPWLEEPFLRGAVEDGGEVIGFLEAFLEKWSNRLMVSNLLVLPGHRGQGVGRALMERAFSEGRALGARLLMLETQTCNAPAIAFYLRCGLSPIGIDLTCYHNDDVQRREVRLNLGKTL